MISFARVIRHESEGEGVQDWRSGWASRAMRSGSGPAFGPAQLPIMSTVRRWRRRLALDRYLNQLRPSRDLSTVALTQGQRHNLPASAVCRDGTG
jgi:hypothetical protein